MAQEIIPVTEEDVPRLRIEVSEHVSLDSPSPSYAPDLFQLIDSNRAYLKQYVAWTPYVQTEEDSRQFLMKCLAEAQRGTGMAYIMLYQNRPAGIISLQNIDRGNKTAYFGYWLDPLRQGLGIVTQSILTLLKHHEGEFSRFVIKCATSNVASNAVATRCGFEKEGVLRKAEIIGDICHDQNIYAYVR
ncbi:GNAT family N-acetyltransferase [Burkholderia perseverans]|uniref:GNAT family N-acetyltransferase n=1 Tax=Burkholderia perseverans TaxID=2615214 RepID=UPI001FEE0E79|nr:GNAT family N-acetyltransferase [Burkholderia perseverans]